MKKITILLTIVLGIVLWSKCKKDNPPALQDKTAEVLIAGNYTPAGKLESAAYWQDGQFHPLEDGATAISHARGIVRCNSKIYVAGDYDNKPCIWEDGLRQDVDVNNQGWVDGFLVLPTVPENTLIFYGAKSSAQKPILHAFAISFGAGYIFEDQSSSFSSSVEGALSNGGTLQFVGLSDSHAVKWVGGNKTDMGESNQVNGINIDLGNNICISGTRKNPNSNIYEWGYWKNVTFKSLGGSEIAIFGLDFYAQDKPYLVGYSKGANGENHATIWEIDQPVTLSGNSSRASALTFFNSNSYVAGREIDAACYWFNKKLVPLKTPNSIANAIYVGPKN